LKSDPQPVGPAREATADRLFLAGCFPQAVAIYQKVLEHEPGRLDIRARLGRLALFQNDPGQAVTHLASVLNNGLRSRVHWGMLADAYLAKGEQGSAALCYENAGRTALAGTLAVLNNRELCRIEGASGACEFEWLSESPLPLIQAEINGIPLNLLVDTAAGDLVLDEKAAIAAGIPHGGRETRYFAGGLPALVTYGHVENLQLGSLAVHDLLTQILDLQARFSGYSPLLPVHGIVGIALLSRFLTVLDFDRRVLRLDRQPQRLHPGQAGAALGEFPFWIVDNHFPVVRVEAPDTESGMWVIDSGMAGAAFAIDSSAEAAGLASRAGEAEAGVGGGGAVQGERLILPSLRLGPLIRRNVEGIALEKFPLQDRFGFRTIGLLGCEFFHGAVMALNFSSMTIALSQPESGPRTA